MLDLFGYVKVQWFLCWSRVSKCSRNWLDPLCETNRKLKSFIMPMSVFNFTSLYLCAKQSLGGECKMSTKTWFLCEVVSGKTLKMVYNPFHQGITHSHFHSKVVAKVQSCYPYPWVLIFLFHKSSALVQQLSNYRLKSKYKKLLSTCGCKPQSLMCMCIFLICFLQSKWCTFLDFVDVASHSSLRLTMCRMMQFW
jgi:hypothetical protein